MFCPAPPRLPIPRACLAGCLNQPRRSLLLGYLPENELVGVATAAETNPAEDADETPTPGADVEDGGDAGPAGLDWGGWLASLVSPYRAAVAADPRLLQLVLCASTSAGTIAVMTQHCAVTVL